MELKYRLTRDGKSYKVVGCVDAIGEIVIPKTHYRKPVTTIGEGAFYGCSGLTSITIPSSVTSIEGAFSGCRGLNSITIAEGVTSIGEGAFSGSGLTSITIPDSVTSIGIYAFYGCSGLTSITIPAGVTSIGNYAFYGCSGLTSITIPSSVTSIGGYAFYLCSGLTSITIPEGVTSIGNYAFYGCSGLTSITIPDSVTTIGEDAFHGCSGLTSKLPKGVQRAKLVKAFNADLTCRGFKFEIGKTYNVDNPCLCGRGFHACASGVDLFNYYSGTDNKDIVFYEVELDGIIDEREFDSKACGSTIKLLRKLTIAEAAMYKTGKEVQVCAD